MNPDNTVFNLAAIAVVLTRHASRLPSTFADSGFVDQPDCLRVRMLASNDLLTPIPQTFFISLDRFQKTL